MTVIKKIVSLPYEIARLPLVAVDHRLSARLDETSAPRVVLDRTIASADKVAGTVLRNREILQRGAERQEHGEKVQTAARLEAEAKAKRDQAKEEGTTGRRKAASQRKAAQDKATSGLQEADVTEVKGKQQARDDAKKQAAEKKAAADKRAADRARAAEKRRANVAAAAEEKKKAAQREAKADIDDAKESKASADEARSDAERLGELTETKKNQRTQDNKDERNQG